MSEITCKKCGCKEGVKNGFVRGKQRYKCSHCGHNYTLSDGRTKGKLPPQVKALMVLLYGSGKASYGIIAKLLNVSRTTVQYWIKKTAESLPEPEIDAQVTEVQIDEMWHFLVKKKRKIWIWRVLDCTTKRTIAWVIGSRSAKTFRKLYDKLKGTVTMSYTDDWEVYKKVIPAKKLTQGKKYTTAIEQNNSNVRHYLARMTRRTKVVSKTGEMLNHSLRICCMLNEYGWYQHFQQIFLSIFH